MKYVLTARMKIIKLYGWYLWLAQLCVFDTTATIIKDIIPQTEWDQLTKQATPETWSAWMLSNSRFFRRCYLHSFETAQNRQNGQLKNVEIFAIIIP